MSHKSSIRKLWIQALEEKLILNAFNPYVVQQLKLERREVPHGFRSCFVIGPALYATLHSYVCTWCEHITRGPKNCVNCCSPYCTKCVEFLRTIGLELNLKGFDESAHFLCISRECLLQKKYGKACNLDSKESAAYDQATFRCYRQYCGLTLDYKNWEVHSRTCDEGPEMETLGVSIKLDTFQYGLARNKLNQKVGVTLDDIVNYGAAHLTYNTNRERYEDRYKYVSYCEDREKLPWNKRRPYYETDPISGKRKLTYPPWYEELYDPKYCPLMMPSVDHKKFKTPLSVEILRPTNRPSSPQAGPSSQGPIVLPPPPNKNVPLTKAKRINSSIFESNGNKFHRSDRSDGSTTIPKSFGFHGSTSFSKPKNNFVKPRLTTSQFIHNKHVTFAEQLSPSGSTTSSIISYEGRKPCINENPFADLSEEDIAEYRDKVSYLCERVPIRKEVIRNPERNQMRARARMERAKKCLLYWDSRNDPLPMLPEIPEDIKADIDKTLAKREIGRYEIIAIHCESMSARVQGKTAPRACWVAITNVKNEVLYSSFIRVPVTDIVQTHQNFHGLSADMVKDAMGLTAVKAAISAFLVRADIIVGAGLRNVTAALGLSEARLTTIRHKFRDVTDMLSPRRGLPFSLRFLVNLVFKFKDFQNQYHHPVLEAMAAMNLYLWRKDYIDHKAETAFDNHGKQYNGPFVPSLEISLMLKEYCQKVEAGEEKWPTYCRSLYYKRNPLPTWNNIEYIANAAELNPYHEDETDGLMDELMIELTEESIAQPSDELEDELMEELTGEPEEQPPEVFMEDKEDGHPSEEQINESDEP